jgi:hypothetical protein
MAAIDGRESFTRRDAYRRLIADSSTLPPDFIQRLDHKRKTLDESIHKFIAGKERELKQWIKQERALYKQQTQEREVKIEHARSRTGSDSTQENMDSPYLNARRPGSHGLLLGSLRKDGEEGSANALDEDEARGQVDARAIEAGIADRRASLERDREFLGVFTPAYLPAFADDAPSSANERDDSPEKLSPGKSTSQSSDSAAKDADPSNQAEDTDKLHEMEGKRPAHLLLSKRFSSGGSSSERLLTSALKSPTEHKPKRKRVSIALGTTIVAPSDSVPMSMDYQSTHSHSLQRAPISDDESSHAGDDDTNTLSDADVSTPGTSASPNLSASIPICDNRTDLPNDNKSPSKSSNTSTSTAPAAQNTPAPSSKRHIDPDGDLFDLEDSDSDLDPLSPSITSLEPHDTALAGRVGVDRTGNLDAAEDPQNYPSSPSSPRPLILDPDDPAPDPNSNREDPATTLGPITSEKGAGIAFRPTAVLSPMSPGFRRPPSYVRDPSYMKPSPAPSNPRTSSSSSLLSASISGTGASFPTSLTNNSSSGVNAEFEYDDDSYARAQEAAVKEEIYGSSYARPTSKGSFSAGSLGESYMARNAEILRRLGGSHSERETGRTRGAEGVVGGRG